MKMLVVVVVVAVEVGGVLSRSMCSYHGIVIMIAISIRSRDR